MRCNGSIVIFCDFDDLNAVGLWTAGLKYDNFLLFFRMNSLSCVSINDHVIDVPRIDHIPCDFFGLLEAEVDFEAGPVVYNISTIHIVSTVESDFIGERSVCFDISRLR